MKYLLTIKIPFEAMDDIEARKKVREYIQANAPDEDKTIKLQENFTDKPPPGNSHLKCFLALFTSIKFFLLYP